MDDTDEVTTADPSLICHSNGIGWQSDDLLAFNGKKVRYRTMNCVEARWHKHDDTDEMFFVLSGNLEIDTRDPSGIIKTYYIGPGQMIVVHGNCEHRARSANLATLLVFDAIH